MKLSVLASVASFVLVQSAARAEGDAPLPPLPTPTSEHANDAARAEGAAPAPPDVFVTIQSSEPVFLERDTDRGWEPRCKSPCNLEVPAGRYRIVSASIKPSLPFTIEGTEPVTLAITPAPRFKFGAIGVFFGPVLALGGGALTVAAFDAKPGEWQCSSCEEDPRGTAAGVGIAGVLIGVVMLGVGISDLAAPAAKATRVDRRTQSARAIVGPGTAHSEHRVRKPDFIAEGPHSGPMRGQGGALVKIRF